MIKEHHFVKAKRSGGIRYVTKIRNAVYFEDDGKVSGQPPSSHCHISEYEYYELKTPFKHKNMTENEQKLFDVLVEVQDIVGKATLPEPELTMTECIDQLLPVVDNEKLIKFMTDISIKEKLWPNSSNVSRTAYVGFRNMLLVTFNSGGTYQYSPVPSVVWNELLDTASIGSFVAKKIKPNYECSRVV